VFNLIGFYSSLANGVTYTSLAGVLDQNVPQDQNGRFIFPRNQQILAALVLGANVQAARINTPSLRVPALPEIYPTVVGTTVPTLPGVVTYGQQGPRFLTNEGVSIDVSHGGAGAEDQFGLLACTDRFTPAPQGQNITLVASWTSTLIKGSWVLGAITFNQILPAGEYTVVGMGAMCAAALAVRLVFPGNNQYRPGCVPDAAYGNKPWLNHFRYGGMGLFGKFLNTAQPSVETLGITAGAQTGALYLDVIKTG